MSSEITSDMIKTSRKLCRTCRYVGRASEHVTECDYLGKTDMRRGCPVGWCNKYEEDPSKAKKRRRKSKKEAKK